MRTQIITWPIEQYKFPFWNAHQKIQFNPVLLAFTVFTHSLCDNHPWIVTVWHHQLTARVPSMATSFHYGISTRVTRSPHGRCIQRRNICSILNYLHFTDTAHVCSFVLRNQLRSRYGRHNLITTRYIFYCQSKHLNVLCATKFLYDNSPVLFMQVLNFILTHEMLFVIGVKKTTTE